MNENDFKNIMELLVPHRTIGRSKVRIGQPYDGGYVHIDDFKDLDLAIGGGLNNDDSWELAMLAKDIPVVAFDPSEAYIYQGVDRGYTWFKEPMKGYASGNSTLDLMLGGYADNSVIAKIDIEGDEWGMFANTSIQSLRKIRQMVIEFHQFPMFEGALAAFKNIHKQFRVVHVHGNNCDIANAYNDQIIPRVIELTFANIDYYDLEVSGEIFPGELDAPNNQHAQDFYLDTFTL
jgi:hypothetical protein